MVDDLTVLLVGDDEPDEKLIEQLEKKNLNVEFSSKHEFSSLLALVEPHIVVHLGESGADQTAQILKDTEEVRRVRLIVVADRDALPGLRGLDKTVVVSLLATDIAASVIAARVLMLAKKGPQKSLRPPAAKPAKDPVAMAPQKKPAVSPVKPAGVAAAKPKPKSLGTQATASVAMKPAIPAAAKSLPPRPAVSLKPQIPKPAVPKPTVPDDDALTLEDVPPSSKGPPSSEAPPSEFPTMAFEAPIPEAARPAAAEVRVVLADSDPTRADIIACALREAHVHTRIVPLDAAATHWPLVRDFGPTALLADGMALKTTGQVWLQLFQADQALKKAKLVAVPFERLFDLETGKVNLRTLIPHIPQLSGELSDEPKPTTGPVAPLDAQPLPAAGIPAEAPVPFDDDDESEFDRMTVARPIDDPLPREASPSLLPELPTPAPAAGVASAQANSGEVLRPFDSLAPSPPVAERRAPDGPVVRALEQTSEQTTPEKSGGGLKIALAALVILGVGGTAGWIALGNKLPGQGGAARGAAAPPPPKATTETPAPPAPPEEAPAPEVTQSPEQILWGVSPDSPVTECETLVTNLKELQAGGIQQATLSLNKARQAMVRGELDAAHVLMCEAVLVHPESLALEELASLLVTKRAPDLAQKWQTKALELRPDRLRTVELGGDIHSQLGRLPEARHALVAALKVDENDQKTLSAVATQYVETAEGKLKGGAFAKAELMYRRAALLDPDNADAYAGLAAANAGAGRVEQAGRWAEKTLELDPAHHIALVVKAAIATEAGDKATATKLVTKALERNPTYLPALQLQQALGEK